MLAFCKETGLLGTTATLCADLNFLMQILMALALLVGTYFALKKDFATHQKIQTGVVALNFFAIALVMADAYQREVVPGLPENLARLRAQIATVHVLSGTLVWAAGIYIVLRMAKRTRALIPPRLRIKNLKPFMRLLLAGWWFVAALGIGTYFVWYQPRPASADRQAAAATPVAIAGGDVVVPIVSFAYEPRDIVVPAGTTVTWRNLDEAPHTVTADDGSFDSGMMQQDAVYARRFDIPGVFPYYCVYHGAPGGRGQAGTVTVVTAAAAVVPTPVSPPTPTAQPAPPLPPLPPLGAPVAIAAFLDVRRSSDGLVIHTSPGEQLRVPPPGSVYTVWLLAAEAPGTRMALGRLPVDAGGQAAVALTDPGPITNRINLLTDFDTLQITLEPAGNAQPDPSASVVYAARLPRQALVEIRTLLVAFDETPGRTGLAVGLRRAAEELARQGEMQTMSLQFDDLAQVKLRAELVVNLIEGARGTRYGDLNGDGRVLDPGDGYGVLPNGDRAGYGQATFDFALRAARAVDASEAVRLHAGHTQVCAQQVLAWAAELRDVELSLAAAPDLTAGAPLVTRAGALADQILRGRDVNGDGIIEPVAGECGATTLYQHAQYMAAFAVVRTTTFTEPDITPTPGP